MDSIVATLVLLVALVISIILHEVAHGAVALLFGDDTAKRAGRLTLNPIPHIDLFGSIILPALGLFLGGFIFGWAKPVPVNFWRLNPSRLGMFFVAIAGVGTNFILAVVAALCARTLLVLDQTDFVQFFEPIILINMILGIFNLIPIPPMDGSKVLYAVINLSHERQNQIERSLGGFTGFFIIIMLLMFGALNPVFQFASFAAHWLLFF